MKRMPTGLFANSQFTSLDKLLELLRTADTQSLTKDPAMELALSTSDMGYELSGQMMPAYEKILRGERELMAALLEMEAGKTFYPDANFTQRMSYGSVRGYRPRDAVWYDYYSTTQGVLENKNRVIPSLMFRIIFWILSAHLISVVTPIKKK